MGPEGAALMNGSSAVRRGQEARKLFLPCEDSIRSQQFATLKKLYIQYVHLFNFDSFDQSFFGFVFTIQVHILLDLYPTISFE